MIAQIIPQRFWQIAAIELERKLDKALRLAFPKASYIVQHRDNMEDWTHA